MDQIISDIGNNYVNIIVDETTDPRGLSIGNLLIGKLDGTPSKSYLVACKELEFTNYETICQFINSSLKIFPEITPIKKRAINFSFKEEKTLLALDKTYASTIECEKTDVNSETN
ncbi:hypothetical protein QTP88_007748 [Uroleucon formosanum]